MAELLTVSEQGLLELSLPTEVDLSSLQYHFVKLDVNGMVVPCGANEKPLGILQNDVNGTVVERTAVIMIQGISYLAIGETVAFGQQLTSTAGSKGEVVDAAGEEIGARSLGAYASTQNAVVQVMFGKAQSSDA